jgi:hypothetical protein
VIRRIYANDSRTRHGKTQERYIHSRLCGLHLLPSVSLHYKISRTPVMRGPACHYVTQVPTSNDNICYIGTHHARRRRRQSISHTLVVTLLAPHIPSIAHLRFIASSFLASPPLDFSMVYTATKQTTRLMAFTTLHLSNDIHIPSFGCFTLSQ